MASSIEDILMAKAMADAERRETDNTGMALGALSGTAVGATAAPMRNTTDLKERALLNARGGNVSRRMAGGLVGAIIGGGLGAGIQNAATRESPTAALLAKLQTQGSLNPMDMNQLQSVLQQLYSSTGM